MGNNTGRMMYDLMVLDKSSEWLENQVNALVDQINFEEAKVPTDSEKLDALQIQLRILYRRTEIEAKIGDQLGDKYGFKQPAMSGTGERVA